MSKKTIKELAEEIGVSKTAIFKKVTESQKNNWFTKSGNQFLISETGQKAIKSMFYSTQNKQSKTDKQTGLRNNENQVFDLHFYQEQLLAKDKQIDTLQLLLKEQQNLLDQQQRLTLQTNKQIEQLQLETTKHKEDNTIQKDGHISTAATEKQSKKEQPQVKKSFFNRLFNK